MLALALTALMTACGNPPVAETPVPVEPNVTNVQFVIDQTDTRAAPGVNASGGSVKFDFNTAMDRKSVENAINIFTGDYNESLNASKLQKLQLTSTCNGRWNIKNPNDSSVSFHWSAYKTERDTDDENDKDHDTDEDKMPQTSEFSDGVVPAKSEASFNTLTGKSQLRVFVNK